MVATARPSIVKPPLVPQRDAIVDSQRQGDSASNIQCDDRLGDMSDSEAMRILDALGGFSTNRTDGRSGSSKTSTTGAYSGSRSGDDGEAAHVPPKADVLPDMDEVEANGIIKKFGGFLKSREHCAIANDGPHTPTNPAAPTTLASKSLPSHVAVPQTVSAPVRYTSPSTDSQPEISAQSPANKFPSRKDVLSARRALMADGGRPSTSSFNSPAKTPSRSALLRKSGATQQSPVGASARLTVAPSPSTARQLVFRSPNLKRPLARPAFSTPTKRVLVDDSIKGASAGPEEVVTQQQARPSPFRQRIPAVLPPVTTRQPVTLPRPCKLVEPQVFDIHSRTERHSLGSIASQVDVGNLQRLPQAVLTMSADLAAQYCFPGTGGNQTWGAPEARSAMLSRGCVPNAVTEGWVLNHYRWCVWSCACYARRLPAQWHSFWSSENIVNRLLYRYEREYVCGERSALKRVLEGDSSSQQLMVLCVASIHCTDNVAQAEVTDGWYGIRAMLDPVLARAASKGRLRVGDKIACAGLRMSGVTEGVSPLTDKAERAVLALNANCVRRAAWDSKLGFQRRKAMFLSLSAVCELGGPVGAALDVVVMRTYPMVYMEMLSDGRRVVRSEKEELRIAGALEGKRVAMTHDLKEKRLMALSRRAGSARSVALNIETCHSGKDLYEYVMHSSIDPADARQRLTSSQSDAFDRYVAEQQSEVEADISEAVDRGAPQRQVCALFRLLVCDYPAHKSKQPEPGVNQFALVTIWRPRGISPGDFAEGSRFVFTGLTVSPRKTGSQQPHSLHKGTWICLNYSSPGSHFKPLPADPEVVQRSEYRERGTLCVDEMCHITSGQEVDLAGRVTGCQAADQPGQSSVLHLSTTDECGTTYVATIEFPVAIFGAVNIASGCQATVRNCVYAPRAGAAPNTFHLRASDGCEVFY
ncbi:hypothetical protein GGI20_000566 [Coemansia sp. BCRC 34301]|nr:hypothetical protein GGI20_000566 [Coemansia sp. BCRC 34301]